MRNSLARVALAISSYRNDEAVLRLLERSFDTDEPRFGAVIVVDSLGTGIVATEAAARNWAVKYVNAERNLGSAGNLAVRLDEAARLGLDWCFTVNHDGNADPAIAKQLVLCAEKEEHVGAVYPATIYTRAGGRLEAPRRSLRPFSPHRDRHPDAAADVAWGSSNSALYNLAAVRDGVTVWADLWMGWEDLAYGWQLEKSGWRQVRCSHVKVQDDYEYRDIHILGRRFYIADKPPWYMYYQIRNLMIIGRRSGWRAVNRLSLIIRVVGDLLLTAMFKGNRSERFLLVFKGLRAGLRNETGKGPLPP